MSEDVLTITKDDILNKWTPAELKQKISTPEGLAEVNRIINTPDEDPAEVAAKEAAQAAEAEAAVIAAAEAETARQTAEAERLAAEVAKPKEKIVMDYDNLDEDGNPTGKRTHLEAETWQEMSEKLKVAHLNSVKYAERMKKLKATPKLEVPVKKGLTDEEIVAASQDLKSDDPAKQVAAVRKITNVDQLEEKARQDEIARENVRRDAIALKWMRGHLEDFNPCEANANMISAYISENDLDWTEDNLEIAFVALESQLASKPAPVRSAVDNPPIEVPVTPPAAVAVPEIPVAVPNPASVKRIPDGGLIPGTLSAGKQVSKPAGLTKKDIAKMPPAEIRLKLRTVPGFREELERVVNQKQ